MNAQEQLMDDFERDLTKVIQSNRHKMYQRMSAEKVSNEALELKYMLRYYDSKNSLRTRVLKPVEGISIVEAAELLAYTLTDKKVYWVFDNKQNLIFRN